MLATFYMLKTPHTESWFHSVEEMPAENLQCLCDGAIGSPALQRIPAHAPLVHDTRSDLQGGILVRTNVGGEGVGIA